MNRGHKQIVVKCELYVQRQNIALLGRLGHGDQGEVFATTRRTAIKALHHEADYRRERDVYLRLRERRVRTVRGCAVPHLRGFDDDLYFVEMTIVRPSCILDFGSAYLDVHPEFPADVVDAERARRRDLFGDAWPLVEEIIAEFASLGVHLMDISAGNILITAES